jgi:hypothetical protein
MEGRALRVAMADVCEAAASAAAAAFSAELNTHGAGDLQLSIAV